VQKGAGVQRNVFRASGGSTGDTTRIWAERLCELGHDVTRYGDEAQSSPTHAKHGYFA
jgi:hypothetical protein